jgi:signal peptidase II
MTKQLTVRFLPFGMGHEVVVFHFFGIDCSLTHAINTGAAWGSFASMPHFLVCIRIILILGLIAYLALSTTLPACFRLPFILIASGALANVLDFFLYGHVIDMIHFVFWGYDYPVFNVADSAICIGTFSVLWMAMWKK